MTTVRSDQHVVAYEFVPPNPGSDDRQVAIWAYAAGEWIFKYCSISSA